MGDNKRHRPEDWTPDSWEKFSRLQKVDWKDDKLLDEVRQKIRALPPLVDIGEIKKLRKLLVEVEKGRMFLLQGGDCAERFEDCKSKMITNKILILLQMSLILSFQLKLPCLRIGRMAGQYSKPRSSPTEEVDGQIVESYKGDAVNNFSVHERTPNPNRLHEAYFYSGITLNYIRAQLLGGVADLHTSLDWNVHYVDPVRKQEYINMVEQVLNALGFMDACGVTDVHSSSTIDFFTSHEALLLEYESCLTQLCGDKWYLTSAHTVWLGERTRRSEAHLEFLKGIENPIGLKIGPQTTTDELIKLCKYLNPLNEQGKIILITRIGAAKVKTVLDSLVRAVKDAGLNVIWQCDPMHGNTVSTPQGLKTRDFRLVLQEFEETWKCHKSVGTILGGVHLELTGEAVTECVGGPMELQELDLMKRYVSYCDPRLNNEQAVEMAFNIANLMK